MWYMSLIGCSSQICAGRTVLVRVTRRWAAEWHNLEGSPLLASNGTAEFTISSTRWSYSGFIVSSVWSCASQWHQAFRAARICAWLEYSTHPVLLQYSIQNSLQTTLQQFIFLRFWFSWQWILWLQPIPWNMTLCNFVDTDQHLAETCCLHLRVEEQSCNWRWRQQVPHKVGTFQPDYISHLTRQ